MCILIAKPKNVQMPSEEIMQNCWESTPDGAGIAWSDGRKIFLRKGFMKWKDFIKEYRTLNLNDYNAIIHFRIATHGTVNPSNTHPFNVNDRIIGAHNGILPITAEGDWTDSETFFKRIASPILENYKLDSLVFEQAVNSVIGSSKLAFLTDRGQLHTFGKFTLHEGVMYSNQSYAGYGRYGKKSKSRGVSCYNYNDYESSYYDDFPYASDKDDSSYADLVYNLYVFMEDFLIEFGDFDSAVSYVDVKNYAQSLDDEELIDADMFDRAYSEAYDALWSQYGLDY